MYQASVNPVGEAIARHRFMAVGCVCDGGMEIAQAFPPNPQAIVFAPRKTNPILIPAHATRKTCNL